ncbi:hypothetical protein TVAG_292920 [Trichomonas vaginalis G3]|uniref:Cell division control protein 24 OB domain-containing protein n=1 Tax=Trichomonas vaginalis (strain ATCC PRA-98 / G3) TaxID=412133 RepID=A2EWY2_TRIV3|nr:nucleic acid-binding proteins superfamily [Trichomonas vaginalis G3]EAY02824.1 hypothetical protein TVAG_292920 [Trichomonas vaginalis G3]KAI5525640.1 nucleic acid-binding proteins superfamily [Trichomonas vaginalis G3]|eukprot:XP_001315047.1 hypothetical protein [Trichomonas vaginalis G3]
MFSSSNGKHSLDLRNFIETENEIISEKIEKTLASVDELAHDQNWLTEQILLLIVQWSTGITTTIVEQDVVKKAGQIKRSWNVKAEEAQLTQTVHASIARIGYYDTTGAYALSLVQQKNDSQLTLALHSAFYPFVEKFLTPGHRVHIANARFSNHVIVPNQLMIIDLKRTKEEINFIMSETSNFSLSKISLDTPLPGSLLLRVLEAVSDGVSVTDGSTPFPYKLILDEERQALKLLLRFNDVIILYRPDAMQSETGGFCLYFGPNTLIFRVPALGDSKMSQLTQRSTTLAQDGLLFRNSTNCRSIHGSVIKVSHFITSGVWSSTCLEINSKEYGISHVWATITNIPPHLQTEIVKVKTNHYIYAFGLSKRENALDFTPESTLFDTSCLPGLLSSDIVPVRPISFLNRYITQIVRAIIVEVTCELKHSHKVCGTVLCGDSCCYCNSHISASESYASLLVTMTLDDGTGDCVEVMCTVDKIPSWGVTSGGWNAMTKDNRKKSINRLIGNEFLFSLSLSNETEFGGYTETPVWRVDMCLSPVGDTQRHIKRMINVLKKDL